ncbi:MAG: hypothetical protein Q9227_005260 [Pyrenula ochraceoflavens]
MPTIWRKVHWPPSPIVEDEAEALAHEIRSESSFGSKSEDEAQSRGSIDQVPIILDAGRPGSDGSDRSLPTDGASVESQSSDESHGPPTPRSVRFAFDTKGMPPTASSSTPLKTSTPRVNYPSKPVPNKALEKEERPRGRPQVSPIDTGLTGDLQEMLTGRRRAPSPYSFTKPEPETLGTPSSKKRSSGASFLSPEAVHPNQGLSVPGQGRSLSAAPRSHKDEDHSTAESGKGRHRHHSRRRSTREEFPERERSRHRDRSRNRDRRESSSDREKRAHHDRKDSLSDRERRRERREERDDRPSHHHERVHEKPRRTDSFSEKERPRRADRPDSFSGRERTHPREVLVHDNRQTSDSRSRQADEYVSRSRKDDPDSDADNRKRSEKRFSKSDSPYASAAEDNRPKHRDYQRVLESEDESSRTKFRGKLQRPALDQAMSHYSFDGSSIIETKDESLRLRKENVVPWHARLPSDQESRGLGFDSPSTRSPKVGEDYFSKAHSEAKRRSLASPRASPKASPESTPPLTPPHTSRATDRHVSDKHLSTSSNRTPIEIPRARTPVRASTIDPSSVVAVHAAKPTRPSRTSSEAYHGKAADSVTNVARSRIAALQPSPIEPPSPRGQFHRSSSFASPIMHSSPSSQRSFSYSSSESNARSSNEEALKASHSYRSPDAQMHNTNNGANAPPRPARSTTSSQETVPRLQSSATPLIEFPPCPRSEPVKAHHDWYTVDGLDIDICPTCVKMIGNSRFRDRCLPNFLPSNKDEAVRCALSEPWLRQAWIQTIKQRRSNLDMLHQILRVPSKVGGICPGKALQARKWFRLPNPETGEAIHNFSVCSACVQSVEIVLPQLRGVFFRPSNVLTQERTCALNCNSRRFDKFMAILNEAAFDFDANRLAKPDMRKFVEHARRTCRLRECTRDDVVRESAWHFIPDLPELTICEECYETFVLPLRDRPIAQEVSKTPKSVPHSKNGVSCQLYSDRMRGKFWEAVRHNDFYGLQSVAKRRVQAEKLLQDKHQMLLQDEARGRDRSTEKAQVINQWKAFE